MWFDESYTVGIVDKSFSSIWEIGGSDVHPVLYYFILKFFNLVFGNNILVYRLFSIIPLAILGVLGFTHIRKDFGEKVGLLFSFLILFLPGITRYGTEIRMYSLAMLFVTITAIYGYRLYKDKFSNKNLIIFGIFSLASAYTHYYGLMASGLINLAIFVYLTRQIKQRKTDFIKFIVCAAIQVSLYVPWLISFVSQVKGVSNGFWIGFSFPDTLIDAMIVPFAGSYVNKSIAIIAATLIFEYSVRLVYRSYKENEEVKSGVLAGVTYLAVIIAACLMSIIMSQAILVDRYLLVAMGLLVFFIAFSLSKENNKTKIIVICILILIISTFNNIHIIKTNYASSNNEMLGYLAENIKEDDTFLIYHNEIVGFSVTTKYLDNKTYFHDKDNWNVGKPYEAYGPNFKSESDLDKIMKELSGRIWIINIPENKLENEIKEVYDIDVIERNEFKIDYDNSYFSFTLIEK